MAERTVVFYACLDIPKHPKFDRLAAFSSINSLSDAAWRVPDGDSDLGVIVDRAGEASRTTRLRFLRIRADAPFKLDAARRLSPVAVARNESITEFTWIVIWPDNYMAAVSSRDAPSHRKLGYYLNMTTPQVTHIVNLLRPDLVQRLKEMRERGLREVQFKVQTSRLQQIEEAGKVRGFSQILSAGKGTYAATLGIDLSVGRSGPDAVLPDSIADGTEQLAHYADIVESLHVKGRNAHGEIETINIKRERIAASVAIDGAATSDRIYAQLEGARPKVEKEIAPLAKASRGA